MRTRREIALDLILRHDINQELADAHRALTIIDSDTQLALAQEWRSMQRRTKNN